MAFKNKTIRNRMSGQEIKFLQSCSYTDGQLLEMEVIYNEYSKEPAPHYHPFQVKDFAVL